MACIAAVMAAGAWIAAVMAAGAWIATPWITVCYGL